MVIVAWRHRHLTRDLLLESFIRGGKFLTSQLSHMFLLCLLSANCIHGLSLTFSKNGIDWLEEALKGRRVAGFPRSTDCFIPYAAISAAFSQSGKTINPRWTPKVYTNFIHSLYINLLRCFHTIKIGFARPKSRLSIRIYFFSVHKTIRNLGFATWNWPSGWLELSEVLRSTDHATLMAA